jgi:hypothetical protein
LKRLGIDNENIKRSEKVQNYTDAANDKIATDAQTANESKQLLDKLQMINHKENENSEAYKPFLKKLVQNYKI